MITDVNYTTRAALFELVTDGTNFVNIANLVPILTHCVSFSDSRLGLRVAITLYEKVAHCVAVTLVSECGNGRDRFCKHFSTFGKVAFKQHMNNIGTNEWIFHEGR